jgi:L-asparaginase II
MLLKAGIDEIELQCGAHWPFYEEAGRTMAMAGQIPQNVHNNCSGKHAGMLATAKHLGEPLENYIAATHNVQKRIQATISDFCQCDLISAPCGIDGCSVPTWAIPLKNLASGFARLAKTTNQPRKWVAASRVIFAAAKTAPYMVAGTDKFCTDVMKSVPRLFAKTGAEGVYCGAIPHAGIGIAVKCDDGATRAAEVIFARALAFLPDWTSEERVNLQLFSQLELKNRNLIIVGELWAAELAVLIRGY